MVTISKILYVLSQWLIGLGFSLIHTFHISRLYENQSKFSHLSTRERELQLSPTEAFYYQFFKRIIEARTFEEGIDRLVFDNLTEYSEGLTINSIKKFHILPEVTMGFLYRNFIQLSSSLNIPTVNCYYVEPDEHSSIDDPKVFINCEGLGEPIFFYLAVVWSLSAITVFLLYMYGYFLHRHVIGGCAVIIYYFCVHENATNVHRAPMMRHNFAIPFIVWQTFYLNLYVDRHQNRKDRTIHQRSYEMIISLIFFTTLANVFWDMSSKIFLAQTFAVFILLQCNDNAGNSYINTGLALDYAITQVISNWLSYCLMYGNMKFLTCGNMSVNVALIIYIVRITVMKIPSDDENPHLRSPLRRFIYTFFFFVTTSWFVQDLMDRFVPQSFQTDGTLLYSLDTFLTLIYLKLPTFYTMLMLYQENSFLETISIGTIRLYCIVFIFKNLSIYVAIKFYDLLHQKTAVSQEMASEMQERVKNYVIEDFLETSGISMRDLSDPKTEKRIQKDLDLLEELNYNYEVYKRHKKNQKIDTKIEKENFLNDIRKLKTQIQKGEKSSEIVDESEVERTKSEVNESNEKSDEMNEDEVDETNQSTKENLEDSLYNVQPFYAFAFLQTFTLFFLALKFVVTPFLCLLSATVPSKSWFKRSTSVYWVFYLFVVMWSFNYPGYKNIQAQYQQKNEFRNPELESLLHWIDKTDSNAVFGAPIEIAAHILLTTKRPLVNHPLIEYPEMIDRTRSLYTIFSKRLSTEVYNQLVKLRVQYVVISYESCFMGSQDGIRLIDIYDYLEPENYDKKAFCVSLFQKHHPTFLKVFENVKYIVVQIFSQSIQLELKKKNVLELQM
ncbi:CLUMA_CG008681, isoform A [Clunio marinus]|uniref:CLUMA_CG008681, isoform A n=1 Tax=Clunio marinus TaxID=568069 RepID=A0A1J1IA50_9DIPT|nr:CLUMA_CG008681, isoform A [Clunio marinus]